MKNAILLAGGKGTRLQPITHAINKSLINVNGKAIIDFPLASLKQLGVENVCIILGGDHFEQVVNYLQDGERYGMSFNYVFQGEPKGISQAINLCKRFVADEERFAVILGDNLYEKPIKLKENFSGAQIILNSHKELNRFGVASILNDKIIKLVEKPKSIDFTMSNYAISGAYLFDQDFFRYFTGSKPSARGEFEILDIIQAYHNEDKLSFSIYDSLWADAGTHESIIELNNYFYNI